jgi:acetate---CoA ligase (ADP-forming)
LALKPLRGMTSFFEPKSIAVAGVSADPNKLGSIIFTNMTENSKKGVLKASVYALNPSRDRIGDHPCYPSIAALPETPELLVIAVPEAQTPSLVRDAARAGVKAAVIITGGYAEIGKADVEKKIGEAAGKCGMRILGPNTIGLVDTWSGVDSLFLRPTKTLPDGSHVVSMLKPLKGEVAIITQSGHLGEVVAEELAASGVGVRAIVGTGNQLDVSVDDVIEYFGDDQHTRVISVYLEGLRDGRRFIEAATRAVRKKPLVVFKVGKTSVGARAALTHTASLVGDYEVYQAALRQSGVIEAHSLQELVDFSVALLMLPPTNGKRLAIVTNAGGVGAIAADEAASLGLRVEPLDSGARQKIQRAFAGEAFAINASLSNPIDLTASVTSDQFVRVVELVAAQPQYDLVLVLPTHHAPGMEPDVAERLCEVIKPSGKAVACCVIGNSDLASRLHMEFMSEGIPSFPTPERAARALAVATEYAEASRTASRAGVSRRHPAGFGRKTGPLGPEDVSRLLRSYGIEEPQSVIVRHVGDLQRVEALSFPVACKLVSPRVLHKTDLGGVVLNVRDRGEAERVLVRLQRLASRKHAGFDGMLVQEMVNDGVELLLGGTRDQSFGAIVVLGLGGIYTELLHEYRLAISPVTAQQVHRMMIGETIGRALGGYRGGPRVNVTRLCEIVSAFSRIMVDNPSIDQMEVNPLTATRNKILAVDVRVMLRPV